MAKSENLKAAWRNLKFIGGGGTSMSTEEAEQSAESLSRPFKSAWESMFDPKEVEPFKFR